MLSIKVFSVIKWHQTRIPTKPQELDRGAKWEFDFLYFFLRARDNVITIPIRKFSRIVTKQEIMSISRNDSSGETNSIARFVRCEPWCALSSWDEYRTLRCTNSSTKFTGSHSFSTQSAYSHMTAMKASDNRTDIAATQSFELNLECHTTRSSRTYNHRTASSARKNEERKQNENTKNTENFRVMVCPSRVCARCIHHCRRCRRHHRRRRPHTLRSICWSPVTCDLKNLRNRKWAPEMCVKHSPLETRHYFRTHGKKRRFKWMALPFRVRSAHTASTVRFLSFFLLLRMLLFVAFRV